MKKDKVIELLNDFNSYEYAVRNCDGYNGRGGPLMPTNVLNTRLMPAVNWDHRRYSRIVNLMSGAINEVLSDNERMVIMRKYLDRNKKSLNEIAKDLNRDRGTISKWHTEALNQLCTALEPLDEEYALINNFDYMFDSGWEYREPA